MRTYFPISRRLFECSRTLISLIYTCVRACRADIYVIPGLYYVNVVHDLYIGNEFFYLINVSKKNPTAETERQSQRI